MLGGDHGGQDFITPPPLEKADSATLNTDELQQIDDMAAEPIFLPGCLAAINPWKKQAISKTRRRGQKALLRHPTMDRKMNRTTYRLLIGC